MPSAGFLSAAAEAFDGLPPLATAATAASPSAAAPSAAAVAGTSICSTASSGGAVPGPAAAALRAVAAEEDGERDGPDGEQGHAEHREPRLHEARSCGRSGGESPCHCEDAARQVSKLENAAGAQPGHGTRNAGTHIGLSGLRKSSAPTTGDMAGSTDRRLSRKQDIIIFPHAISGKHR